MADLRREPILIAVMRREPNPIGELSELESVLTDEREGILIDELKLSLYRRLSPWRDL